VYTAKKDTGYIYYGCLLMCECVICCQPKVVSDTEEAELAKQLEKLEEANKEVAGDDDADSYDEDEGSGGEEKDK